MRRIIISIFAFMLAGCSASMMTRLDNVQAGYAAGDYSVAREFSADRDISSQNNLEVLITADAAFHTNDFATSDAAYEEFNRRHIDLTGGDIGREIGALLGGNMSNDYRPYMMDALFVSYYQLWNTLALGNTDDARVVINQSYARQQQMSREYDKLVQETQKSITTNPTLADKINSENSQWLAFRNIMNPGLMYLSGIYFLNMGDFNNAKTYLARTDGMTGGAKPVAEDLAAARRGTTPKNIVWVFIEDGFAPRLYENRIDMPFMTDNGMTVISLALAQPVFWNNTTAIDGATQIADVDALFMTEFTQYSVNAALRAFTAATSRAMLQSAMYNSNSDAAPLLGLISTVYSVSTTDAEVRTWPTLPSKISVLRTKNNHSGHLDIKSGGNVIARAEIPKNGNCLVYVRIFGDNPDTKVIQIK